MYTFNFNEEEKKKKNGYEPTTSPDDNFFQAPVLGDSMAQNNATGSAAADNSSLFAEEKTKPLSLYTTGDKSISARNMLGQAYRKKDVWGDSFFNYTVPEANPDRAGALYSVSPQALDEVASNYYQNELSAKYRDNLNIARDRANRDYTAYSSNPFTAMRKVNKAYDPLKILDSTMNEIDMSKLRTMVEPLARRGGFDTDTYINDYVKPVLRDKLISGYINSNKPKNSVEFIMRSSLGNSLTGKLSNIGFGNKTYSQLENASLESYDANRLEKFAAGLGSLFVDAPVFAGLGAVSGNLVGKTTNIATNKLASRLYSYKAAEGMSKLRAAQIAERAITENLRTRIMQSAAMQGLTLGKYDLANSIAEDVIYNEEVDAGKALGSFVKGATTGAVTGAVGTRLKKMARGLTGGLKMLASTGVLSAESAVFTLSTEMEKLARDIEIEPIDLVYDFAESTATLGTMRMTHWRPKGAENKLKPDGTLKDELRLSKSEQAELREINIDPQLFMKEVEQVLNLPSYGLASTRSAITEKYLQMMHSKEVSAATKSKLMYLIENKLTSTPPVAFDYGMEQNRRGEWIFTTYDFEGNRIERRLFEHLGKVKNFLLVKKGELRNNRIAAYERELLQGVDSQNLLRQAGLYAQEKGVSIDDVSQALYKRAQNAPLSGWEEMLVRDIVDRASYDQSGMVQFLADMRRNIEKKHGLEDGSLLVKVNEQFYKCSDAENKALDEYEALVRNEVDALKEGTDKGRAAELRRLGEESDFKGMTNEEVKSKEIQDFYTAHPDKVDAVGSGEFVKPIEIDDSESAGYVWSYDGVDNTVEDIKAYEKHAREYAKKFNFDVEFISDEREIPYPNVEDKYDVMNYNNKLRAMGWLDRDGKITINLPNIPSVEELERTVVHECVAHGGLMKLFGFHMNSFLEEVYRKASSDVRMAIGNVKSRYPFADNFTVIEEYLAHLTEKVVMSSGERALMTDFKDFVKNSLVRLNIFTGRNRRITEGNLRELLRQHAKYVEKRISPSKYRRWVFGLMDAAKQNEKTYYDRGAYEEDLRAKINGGKYFINTPDVLYNTKLLQNYEFLPEEKKQQALRRWNATDEQVMALKSNEKHRFVGKKGADNKAYYDGFEDGDPELARAIELEKNGAKADHIRFATGWHRGVDNQWRKEMPDGAVLVTDNLFKSLAAKDKELARDYLELKEIPLDAWGYDEKALWNRVQNVSGDFLKDATLKDILNDPTFYSTYPELADLPLEMVDNAVVPLRYDSRNKKMIVDRSFFVYPENSVYMSGVLQNVIQDYEGFSKAVSMNLVGINSRIERKYKEAQKIIALLDKTRQVVPDFDRDRMIDKAFEKEYHFTPEEFSKHFPSLDEYIIYKLTGKDFAFSGNVEMRNVMNRFDANEFDGRIVAPEVTEDVPRSRQVPITELADLKRYFNGPLDIIYQKLLELHSDEPLMLGKTWERVRRADLTPLERSRFETEMEEHAQKVLQKLIDMGNGKDDYGYGEFKKREYEKRKRLHDAVEFQKWRNGYRHLEDELDELN